MEDSPEAAPRHRFSPATFLIGFGAGAFIGVALATIAIALIQGDNNSSSKTSASALAQPTAALAVPTADIRPRTKAALDVRLGPGTDYAVIGLLSRGEAVEPVGRDASSQWLAIRFPPESAGQGWVPVSQLDGADNLQKLAVALPTPLPRTIESLPLATGSSQNASAVSTAAAGGSPIPVPTPTAKVNTGPGDLYVASISRLSDGRVTVVIGNKGPGDVAGFSIFVLVRNLAANSEQLQTSATTLPAGATISLTTDRFRVENDEDVVAIVDPYGSIPDVNRGNNTLQVTLAVPHPTATTPPSTNPY